MIVDLSRIKSGFSDKLRAITFFIALSKFKKIKNFRVYEKKNYQCPFRFADYCKIKKIKIKLIKKNIEDKKKILFNSYNSEINMKNCRVANKYSFQIENKELLLEWKNSYKEIIPNFSLKKKINKINLPKNFISIHIRSTDRVVKFKNTFKEIQLKDMIFDFQLLKFSSMVINFLQKHSRCRNVYISSDQENLKMKVINKLKKNNYRVFFNNCNFKDSAYRQTKGVDFLIDLFCISKSKIIFSTVGGGVPITAHLLSGKKNKIICWIDEMNRFYFLRIFFLLIYYVKRMKFILFNFHRFK